MDLTYKELEKALTILKLHKRPEWDSILPNVVKGISDGMLLNFSLNQ